MGLGFVWYRCTHTPPPTPIPVQELNNEAVVFTGRSD